MDVRMSSLALVALLLPTVCAAQVPARPLEPPRVEVVGDVALGRVFRFEDRAFGNHLNLGAGVSVQVWRRLYAGAGIDRTLGLTPAPVRCGTISLGPGQAPLPCVGTAREGPSAVTVMSVTALYYFTAGRVQPFVTGGVSILSSTEFASLALVQQDVVRYSEMTLRDTGAGLALGGGLRIAVTPALSVRTEMRLATGAAMSRSNLSRFRLSTGVGYGW